MINKYSLTATRSNIQIDLEYKDTILTQVKMAFKDPLNEDKFRLLVEAISLNEHDIVLLEKLGFKLIKELATNQKIALFCEYYDRHYKIKYKVSPADSGKLKGIKVNDQILTCYFASDNFLFKGKHTIANLVKYYNELMVEVNKPAASKHPDYFSQAYQDKLSTADLPGYWEHLRSLGYKPKKNGINVVIDWIK